MLKIRFSLLKTFRQRINTHTFRNSLQSFSSVGLLVKWENRSMLLQTNPLIDLRFIPIFQSSDGVSLKEVQKLADIILDTDPDANDSHSEDKAELLKVLKLLLSRGCTMQDIKQKCINYINTNNSSYVKALLIAELDPDMTALLPLMSLSLVALRKAAKQARDDKSEIQGFPNRIAYLSHHLEKSPSDLMPALAKHSSLLTMQFQRLELKMDILKSADISPEYIVKDLWIFNYNEGLLASRISAAATAGVVLKPWMLRCSQSIFESVLIKSSAAKKILGEDDEITYLAKKLECSKDYVQYILERNVLLKAINTPKLEQVLNFLYGKGYTPQEIRLFPRVFCSSVKTLSTRFDEYVKIRKSLPTISNLCISTERFKKKLEKLEKAEKKYSLG